MSIIASTKFPKPTKKICDDHATLFQDYDLGDQTELPIRNDATKISSLASQIRIERDGYRGYLIIQLLRLVVNGEFNLWDLENQVKPIPRHLINNPTWDSSAFYWSKNACIYQSDLIRFCKSEKILIEFDGQGGRANEQIGSQTFDSRMKLRVGDTANHKELANAFRVKDNEDENRKWFHERCSNHERYKAFEAALGTPGKKGGEASTFRVLEIAAFLLEKNHIKNWRQLRVGVSKIFPSLLDDFDTFFDTEKRS
jgi:hypothetical protein